MELEMYDIVEDGDEYNYKFFSEGPRGTIEKGVRFQPYPDMGENVFNLSFGDLNEITGKIDDLAVSNNDDLEKVLGTVAGVVIKFFEIRPDIILSIEGSSLSRTRLYQIKISKFLDAIRLQFEVYGFYKQDFIPFEKGRNYDAFLIFKI